jgi:hypothetical protein
VYKNPLSYYTLQWIKKQCLCLCRDNNRTSATSITPYLHHHHHLTWENWLWLQRVVSQQFGEFSLSIFKSVAYILLTLHKHSETYYIHNSSKDPTLVYLSSLPVCPWKLFISTDGEPNITHYLPSKVINMPQLAKDLARGGLRSSVCNWNGFYLHATKEAVHILHHATKRLF